MKRPSMQPALMSLLLCCTAVPMGPQSPAAAVVSPGTVSLQVEASGRHQLIPRTVAPGETLHSGDAVTFKVWVDRPSYIYLILYSDKDWSEVLFPAHGEHQIKPGEVVRTPGQFVLDDKTGVEHIYVLASAQPIRPATCAILRVDCNSRLATRMTRGGNDKPPPPPPPPPPPGLPQSQRSLQLSQDVQHTVHAQSDKNGEALLYFSFKHES